MKKKEYNEFVDKTMSLTYMTYGFILGGIITIVDYAMFLVLLSILLVWILVSLHRIKKSYEEL